MILLLIIFSHRIILLLIILSILSFFYTLCRIFYLQLWIRRCYLILLIIHQVLFIIITVILLLIIELVWLHILWTFIIVLLLKSLILLQSPFTHFKFFFIKNQINFIWSFKNIIKIYIIYNMIEIKLKLNHFLLCEQPGL